jgi:hypothetical protein
MLAVGACCALTATTATMQRTPHPTETDERLTSAIILRV